MDNNKRGEKNKMKSKAYLLVDIYDGEETPVRIRKDFETYREFEAFLLGLLEQNKFRKEKLK